MKSVHRITHQFVYSIGILFFFSAAWAHGSSIDKLLSESDSAIERNNSPYWQTLQRYSQSKAQNNGDAGNLTLSPRIIGGQVTSAGNYPWIVALLASVIPNAREAAFCGGTLVEPDLVVTAAHCVKIIESSDDVEVAIGVTDLRTLDAKDRIPVAAFIYNPNYNESTVDSDIALIRLAHPVGNATLPYITPSLMAQVTSGRSMRILGYGMTNDAISEIPNQLQTATVPYVDHSVCNTAIQTLSENRSSITNTQICAGSGQGNTDACFGDSGGPLTTSIGGTTYLTGVVSWGLGCALPGSYGVYTEVADFSSWIATAANILYIDAVNYLGFIGEDQTSQRNKSIYNHTGAPVTIGVLTLQSGNAGISISNDNCSNSTVATDASCTFTLDFDPSGVNYGRQSDVVSVPNNANSNISMELVAYKLRAVNANGALDVSSLKWYSGGRQGVEDWSEISVSGSKNGSAMRSADITSTSNSILATTIYGPATVTFDWKSSSDSNSFVIAATDGVISFFYDVEVGTNQWNKSYVNIPSGTHQLVWGYFVSDLDRTAYNDHAWVDNVSVTKNAWLSYKAPNTSDVNPLGKGSVHFWLLSVLLLLTLIRLHGLRSENNDG